MHINRLLTLAVALILFCAPALALPLWELEGRTNRIHLLGSIHFLRASDYPLPDKITQVFNAADIVVFELDLSQIDPLATVQLLPRNHLTPVNARPMPFMNNS